MNFRKRIYSNYAWEGETPAGTFDAERAALWGRAYDYYLRGWLPEARHTPVADLACGQGRFLHFLLTRGYKDVQGIDISPQQVQLARQVTQRISEGDVLRFLDRPGQSFGLIVALDLVEHLSKNEIFPFVDGCYRALRIGGRLILQTPNGDSPLGMADRYGDLSHEVCFTPRSLGSVLRVGGFQDIESRELGPVPYGYSVKSTGRYLLWRGIRLFVKTWNLVETGHRGSEILTRVFCISGVKR